MRFRIGLVGAFIVLSLLSGCQKAQHDVESRGPAALDLSTLMPDADALEAVASASEYMEYDRDTLFEYMNGGAEVFLALDYSRVGTREYLTSLGEDIYMMIEIYDMGNPDHAREIYQKDSMKGMPPAGLGEESAIGGGALEFWYSRYFIRTRCDDVGEDVDRLLNAAARTVHDRLKERA